MNLDGITPASIRRELTRLGYEPIDLAARAGDTWASSESESSPTVLVPREPDERVRGYREVLASAVERISWITGTAVDDVVARLLSVRDRLELRVVHIATARHSIRVADAPKVIKGFTEVIKSGARTEVDGAHADHRRAGSDKYKATLDSIELLAPSPGSFRLVAVSTDLPQLHLHTDQLTTSARGALVSTLDALEALHACSQKGSQLTDGDLEHLVDAGVSVQMLRAVQDLASFTTTRGLELEFTGEWDPTLGPAPRDSAPVVLTDADVALAKQLKPRLAKQYQPRSGFPLHGWVKETKSPELDLDGHPHGSVLVEAEVNGKKTLVGVDLDASTFPRVTAGASEIHAVGTLERVAGRWKLSEVTDLKVDRIG